MKKNKLIVVLRPRLYWNGGNFSEMLGSFGSLMQNLGGLGTLGAQGGEATGGGSLMPYIFKLGDKLMLATKDVVDLFMPKLEPTLMISRRAIRGYNLGGAMDLASTAVELVGLAVNMGTAVNDKAKAIKEDIKGNLVTPNNVTSTTNLLNLWSAFNPIQHITWKDLTNKGNAGSFIMDSLSMGSKGAAAGSSLGPVGAIAGGVGGTLAGIFGNVAANVLAKKLAKKINRFIDSYNLASLRAFSTAADELDDTMILSDLRNYTGWSAAYGGPLNRNSNMYKDGGPIFNPYTKTWYSSDGKVMNKRKWYKKYGYTLYTDDGFAVNYNKLNREIGRRKGDQTPSIKGNSRNKRELEYFNRDKEFTDSVKVISKRYGLNPNLVASRMAREGVDVAIDLYNNTGGNSLVSKDYTGMYREGPLWGLDHFTSETESGRTVLKEPWVTYEEMPFINEKDERTRSAHFGKWSDAISGTAALLSAIRGRLAKKYPYLNSTLLDAATSAAFNMGEGGVHKKIKDGSYLDYKPFINLKALGGNLMTHGANFDTGIIFIGNGGSHEENPYEGVLMGMDDLGIPNLVEEGEVIFNDYVFSKRLLVPKYARKKYRLGGPLSFALAALKMSKESEERPNDPISQTGLLDSMLKLMIELELIRNQELSTMLGNKFYGGGSKKKTIKINPLTFEDYKYPIDIDYSLLLDKDGKWKEEYKLLPVEILPFLESPLKLETDALKLGNIEIPGKTKPLEINMDPVNNSSINSINSNNSKSLDYLRLAPILSLGSLYLQDLFGLSNRPDFNLGRLIRLANNLLINVGTRPAGYKRFYKPVDLWAAINDFNALMAALRSAIRNAGNRVLGAGNLLASAYNLNLALGLLYAGMEDTNWRRLGEVISHNTLVDLANRLAELSVALTNANLGTARANNLIAAAKADADEEQAYATARAANRDNFYNSLGELGKERANRKMMQGLLESDIFGTLNLSLLLALNYMGINPLMKRSESKGGKIKRRKKKGLTY